MSCVLHIRQPTFRWVSMADYGVKEETNTDVFLLEESDLELDIREIMPVAPAPLCVNTCVQVCSCVWRPEDNTRYLSF